MSDETTTPVDETVVVPATEETCTDESCTDGTCAPEVEETTEAAVEAPTAE